MKDRLNKRLFQPTDALPLEIFRYFFILTLILQFYSFYAAKYLQGGILAPVYLFTFQGFSFLSEIPEGGMKFLYALLLIAPILMLIKKAFRFAVFIYLVAFSFFFLVEQSYYNNHFYLIILYCFFWLFYNPQKHQGKLSVPGWLLFLFQIQLFIVYFYGGLVKLNFDWLVNQEPMATLLRLNSAQLPSAKFATSSLIINYLTYGGLIFDLLIGFLLLNRKTLWIGIIINTIFHLTNIFLFNIGEGGDIGIFPIMMILTNVIFIPAHILRNWAQRLGMGVKAIFPPGKEKPIEELKISAPKVKPWLLAYFMIQLLLPFRYHLIGSDVDWTGQASFFSWRMKSYTKQCEIKFFYQSDAAQPKQEYKMGRIINTMQIDKMAQHANMIYQFIQFIKKDLKRKEGLTNPIITADVKIAFNGRSPQNFIDPKQNLTHVEFSSFSRPNWVLPLK
jgi:hypothetical protein